MDVLSRHVDRSIPTAHLRDHTIHNLSTVPIFFRWRLLACGSESVKDATDGVAGMIRAQGKEVAPSSTHSHV